MTRAEIILEDTTVLFYSLFIHKYLNVINLLPLIHIIQIFKAQRLKSAGIKDMGAAEYLNKEVNFMSFLCSRWKLKK